MSACAFTRCADPRCPVCRFAGRDPLTIQRDLWYAWRVKHLGIRDELPPVKYPEPKQKKGKA
jgi:hypothetical protein